MGFGHESGNEMAGHLIQFQDVQAALTGVGLLARGGFHVTPSESVDSAPPLSDGRPTRTIILAGNAGPAMWEAFSQARTAAADPLDHWSRSVLETVATRYNADVIMPSDGPPYAPFQQWAMRAESVHPSPLGILIHPKWGLWHGYRGALLFPILVDVPAVEFSPSPCSSCVAKPCLSRCPVGAFTGADYLVSTCADYLGTSAGGTCLEEGCLARHACPIGQETPPSPDQANFHMSAFLSTYRK
jgi:hypothetical protein